MSNFKREERYFVVKYKDLDKLPPEIQSEVFFHMTEIEEVMKPKSILERRYVVVEDDWPEYEVVWKMIEERMLNV